MNEDSETIDTRDVSGESIHWDQDISYGSYLDLDELLSCQNPRGNSHDEMMFVIIHQASELWLKLCIHEIGAAMREVGQDNLRSAFKMLSRVSRIQGQLRQSWSILSTMTPVDYLSFRDDLGQSSGFQSFQYREIEYALGNKNAPLANVHRQNAERFERLQKVLASPSFYDLCLQHLARVGFDIPEEYLDRDWSKAYVPSASVEAAWKQVYQRSADHWEQYELAEKLVDLEHEFQMWRFSHMKTVERIIGYRKGTGGTSGVAFLEKALKLRFFPELWTVRTELEPE